MYTAGEGTKKETRMDGQDKERKRTRRERGIEISQFGARKQTISSNFLSSS
jgi:hypothetical protein